MADRRAQVVLLLESRFDHLWLPPGSLRTQPGLAPADRRPCTVCGGVELRDDFGKLIRRRKGAGRVRDRFKRWQACPTCRGDGWTARDRMDSTRQVLGSTETSASARPRKTVLCDGCGGDGASRGEPCRYCAGVGRRELHAFELHLDSGDGDGNPVEAAIVRRDLAGSYHELDLALAGVVHHVNKPARYAALASRRAVQARRLLDELHLPPHRDPGTLAGAERVLYELTLGYLAERMPDPIRVPADVRQAARAQAEQRRRVRGRSVDPQAREQRDRQARAWAHEGKPYPWIAATLGLTDRQLRRILNGQLADPAVVLSEPGC